MFTVENDANRAKKLFSNKMTNFRLFTVGSNAQSTDAFQQTKRRINDNYRPKTSELRAKNDCKVRNRREITKIRTSTNVNVYRVLFDQNEIKIRRCSVIFGSPSPRIPSSFDYT